MVGGYHGRMGNGLSGVENKGGWMCGYVRIEWGDWEMKEGESGGGLSWVGGVQLRGVQLQ